MPRKRATKNATIIAKGTCPDCGARVTGEMPPNECCFTTFCKQCNEFKLEDGIGWDQPVSNKSFQMDAQATPSHH